ncbi:acyl-CoA thioesterase [Ornithinimicrobium tianjinense]|uniref:Acyl-CoA thioesterase II n=1 Tax=Ornithinimicrobium tianjinense TaxID=1195761 RepID=A0A917BHK2_9MICO|nr:acyl-CoA thioesterase II [Ornithinimicrobium tianjinense]GGF42161.1 acyl-CoA thioesterase II [Ornithinimicrobium tianjinense]
MTDAPLLDPIDDLLDVLDLTYEGPTTIEVASPTEATGDLGTYVGEVYTGRSQPQLYGRVFGGQVLAQCVMAAGRSVAAVDDGDGPRHIHSLHGYFLRPGDASKSIQFVVEGMRDGRSFSARRVHATQEGRILLSMITSFQEPAEGLDHQIPMPDVPRPEELRSDREILARIDHPYAQHTARSRAVDLRHVERLLLGPADPGPSEQSVWMRVERPLPDDHLLHAAILAYASDYTLLEPILRRHGIGWGDPRLRPASLDHSMWFHRPGRVDDWFLYSLSSPSAESGRGLGMGHMFGSDGTLLATVGQEGMVRLKG